MADNDPIVFVVDDDPSVCRSLERLIRSLELDVKTFLSAEDFLDYSRPERPSCILLDIRMRGLSGLELQEKLPREISPPIIFVTGHGTVSMSVRAMKAGAADFLVKPFDDQALLDTIYRAIEQDREAIRQRDETRRIGRRVDSLTHRERDVFPLVVAGKPNKETARDLGISEKTVKVHRGRIMQKMGAESLADLVRLAERVKGIRPKG